MTSGSTVKLVDPDELLVQLLPPLKLAVTACEPGAMVETEMEQEPDDREHVDASAAPSTEKVMVPLAVPGVTDAPNVMAEPWIDEGCVTVNAVVDGIRFTVSVAAFDVALPLMFVNTARNCLPVSVPLVVKV